MSYNITASDNYFLENNYPIINRKTIYRECQEEQKVSKYYLNSTLCDYY